MKRKVGRPPLYPWPEWSDGTKRRIERWTDYDCRDRTMRETLRCYARKHDLVLEHSFIPGRITFRFVKET